MVDLANFDNMSDLTKPISIATQSALTLKPNSSDIYTKGQVGISIKRRQINNLYSNRS